VTAHDPEEVTAHALGLLDGPAASTVDAHLATCADCRREWADVRETAALLETVPPETLVDAPPLGDLALRRALRRIDQESGVSHHSVRRPRFGRLVAAAAAALVLLTGGVVIGRVTAPAPSPFTTAANAHTVEGSQGTVRMSATIVPASGWVRLSATVQGLPPGQRCTLLVLADDGTAAVAGSWLTPNPTVPGRSGTITGSTIVDPTRISAVAIRNDSGDTLISVPYS
jgi:anti-sigma factor RsiW